MKPTFGRISRYGVFPLSWTLDHMGPLTRTVSDNAHVLGVLCGHDDRDPASLRRDAEDFTRELDLGVRGLTIGVPDEAGRGSDTGHIGTLGLRRTDG